MRAYVGGYTTKERNGRGEGINVYRIDETSGAWAHVQLLRDIANPSWLTLDRRRRVLYSAHGVAVAPSGRFGWEPRQGKTPRFFALDPSGARLYAANQDSDTIVAFRVDDRSGTLTPTGQVVKVGSPSAIVFA